MILLKNILNEQVTPSVPNPRKQKILNTKDSVSKIANKIDQLGLGAPIASFLIRIASVESCYGLNKRAGNNIWQVDPIAFKDTQNLSSHPGLKSKFKILKDNGIDWPKLTYTQIKSKPLLNAIAARLYIGNMPGDIPKDLKGQANYWKSNYNTSSGGGSTYEFIKKNSGDGTSGCIDYV